MRTFKCVVWSVVCGVVVANIVCSLPTMNIGARWRKAKEIEKKHGLGHSHSRLYLYPYSPLTTLPLYMQTVPR